MIQNEDLHEFDLSYVGSVPTEALKNFLEELLMLGATRWRLDLIRRVDLRDAPQEGREKLREETEDIDSQIMCMIGRFLRDHTRLFNDSQS